MSKKTNELAEVTEELKKSAAAPVADEVEEDLSAALVNIIATLKKGGFGDQTPAHNGQ